MATPPTQRTALTDAQRWILAGVAALALLLVVALVVVSGNEDGDVATETTTTTTTEVPEDTTTTTEAPEETTTTPTFTPEVDAFAVVFPSPNDSRSFEAPASAARAFATDVLGFTELVLGGATSTGDDTAEVVVQDREGGPETLMFLQRLQDDGWYVTAATTEDVSVTQPAPGTSLASPFETSGEALAFEGAVEVLVLRQDDLNPIGQGVVTGSGTPPAGPFQGRIEFTPPEEPIAGLLVYRVSSPEDGRVVQATALPVRLTPFTS